MSIHFNKQCMRADNIVCEVPTETKWNKTQPKLVIRGFAKEVIINKEGERITAYIK